MTSPPPPVTQPSTNLTGGRRIARSTIWNLVAQILPLVVALVCIPLIIRSAGVERFGVLALAWALIGYSSFFDLGIGRALTQVVAKSLGTGREAEVPRLVWTGTILAAGAGLLGAMVLLGLAPWLARSALNVSPDLQDEAIAAFRLVAFTIPIVTSSVGLRGVVEAHQEFRTVAAINSSTGALTFAGPLMALSISVSADAMVAALVVARVAGGIAYAGRVMYMVPGPVDRSPGIAEAKSLLRFGSWMTVSNLVGPLMDYMDRFIVGALLSVVAVAYYATPFDIVSRLGLIAGALAGVLFPAFSSALATDRRRALALYRTGIRHVLMALTPVVLILVAFAPEGLTFWLGDDFARESQRVVQWLAIGILINAVARMPLMLLQAAGRPDITARLHAAELPLYLVAVLLMVPTWGITGAAVAWTVRVAADAGALLYMSHRLLGAAPGGLRAILVVGGCAVAAVAAAAAIEPLPLRAAYVALVLGLMAAAYTRWLIEPGEISRLIAYFRFRNPRGVG
jgi:O-antigen/teichoic acid export membrane protein